MQGKYQLHDKVTIDVGMDKEPKEVVYCGLYIDVRKRTYYVYQTPDGSATYAREVLEDKRPQKTTLPLSTYRS